MSARGSEQALERLRDLRRRAEDSVLPLATSIEGRRFGFQAPLRGDAVRPGAYVVLETDGPSRLGQCLRTEMAQLTAADVDVPAGEDGEGLTFRTQVGIRALRGEGVVLEGDGRPFHDAGLRPASPDEVSQWLRSSAPRRAGLPIGTLQLAPGVPFALDAGGFDRHTFLCGQSGSGKTYALGLMLEQLLLHTTLRMVVLDPNSDFTRMSVLREDADEQAAHRYAEVARAIAVHRAGTDGPARLRIRFPDLDPSAQAALLRLDPIRDRAEHAKLVEVLEDGSPAALGELIASDDPIGVRARNLGIHRWSVWAREQGGSVIEALADPSVRCLVVDLGSLPTREEQALVADAVLAALWGRRTERSPVLVVIDEAHNVCPQVAEDTLTAQAAEHAVRIAGEGRKFGIYLLVSTQRPQKVHENVLSQCDNLVLMRMNSAADLEYAGALLSFVPPGLLSLATTFRLGEGLVAGKLSSHPALVRFGARIAQEGGSDIEATWAAGSAAD
ncbi:MAG TPA: ATP-binding protein [Solirubrobacteraceae bacterium]|nr:ATP-binding protein [Solirubrobacteraceae bacterium]